MNSRVLLDSAAQRSFINKDVSRRLIKIRGHESLRIHTFAGGKNPPVSSQNRVHVLLKDTNSDYTFSLEALESESICLDMIGMPNAELCNEI